MTPENARHTIRFLPSQKQRRFSSVSRDAEKIVLCGISDVLNAENMTAIQPG
jgi:hypothetical protein